MPLTAMSYFVCICWQRSLVAAVPVGVIPAAMPAARIRPIVPVAVLAQGLARRPPHQISRVLKGCDILPDDQHIGRAAGAACAVSGTADVVDAIIIATAVRHQSPIVTSDPGDLTHIADAIGVKIRLYPT